MEREELEKVYKIITDALIQISFLLRDCFGEADQLLPLFQKLLETLEELAFLLKKCK